MTAALAQPPEQPLRILKVDDRTLSFVAPDWTLLDEPVNVYDSLPSFWYRLQRALRFSPYAAWRAARAADSCDLIWAGSEAIGIPLALLRPRKPVVVVVHHIESRWKACATRVLRVPEKWDGVAYVSDQTRHFLREYFGLPENRLAPYESAKYLHLPQAAAVSYDGPILGAGVARRDYQTLIQALASLPECGAELLVSSRFGDRLTRALPASLPPWVRLPGWVSESALIERYATTRFCVVPLQATTHGAAGVNSVFEAAAFSKPVVATRTGGMETFVRHDETGLLVPPGDVEAMRAAIRQLHDDPLLVRRLGQNARRYVSERFEPTEVHKGLERLMRAAVARGNRF